MTIDLDSTEFCVLVDAEIDDYDAEGVIGNLFVPIEDLEHVVPCGGNRVGVHACGIPYMVTRIAFGTFGNLSRIYGTAKPRAHA